MALPRFIEIDGRRYLWRDLVALRRAQVMPAAVQPALFTLREDHRPAGERGTVTQADEGRGVSISASSAFPRSYGEERRPIFKQTAWTWSQRRSRRATRAHRHFRDAMGRRRGNCIHRR
jgi:hypothetical protein